MTYRGHVRNGKIELDDAAELPEGAAVELSIVSTPEGGGEGAFARRGDDGEAPALEAELDRIWADVPEEEWEKLPSDLMEQLDYYLYGTPER